MHSSGTTNVGLRLFHKPSRAIDEKALRKLADCDIAQLTDAMNGFGAVDAAIAPVYNSIGRVAGPALTVKTQPGCRLIVRKAMSLVEAGDVVVVDARGDIATAVWGGTVMEQMVNRGIAGLVVDGAVRDLKHIERLGVPTFARSVNSMPASFSGAGEINVPVCCGGVVVDPGDIVVMSEEAGVVVVPGRDHEAVLTSLTAVEEKDRIRLQRIKNGDAALEFEDVDQRLEQAGFVVHSHTWRDR